MKPYDPKNFGKPQIRLPGDDDHEPNPYDSRTPINTTPRWIRVLPAAIAFGVGIVIVRNWEWISSHLLP